MSSGMHPCRCGALVPPLVSVASESGSLWQCHLKCSLCGLVAEASACEVIGSLVLAVIQWNTLTTTRWLYKFPRMPSAANTTRP
jgi:hypothetical protein